MADLKLTPREQDILKLLCQGYSNDAIAEQLVLSLGTVKWYNKQIFAKLGVSNRVQATLVSQKLNLDSEPTTTSAPTQFPLALMAFVGRSKTIGILCQLLTDHRLITLVGMGGIGKTRLALEVARHFPQRGNFVPHFVPLAHITHSSGVMQAIGDSLGIAARHEGNVRKLVVDYLLRVPTLLILDNFEHLNDAVPLVESLLRSVPEIRLLVTSRERLHLYGETVFPLDGLSVTQTHPEKNSEAVELFLNRAQHADATFHPDDQQWASIADICKLLQGIPLAIEQAASWIHVMNPSDILAEIKHGLGILRTETTGIESRHRSMRAVIESSWQRLPPLEQEVLMCLSVFYGGFSREAAEMVARADLDTLSSLLAKSFVAHRGDQRYDLHEIHRQYAFEKLVESDRVASVRERHAKYYVDMVCRLAPQRWHMSEAQIEAMGRLDADYANIRAAVHWSFAQEQPCLALTLLGYGAIFFYDRGHSVESIQWIRTALARCQDDDASMYARAYFALALQDSQMTDGEHDTYLRWALGSQNHELTAIAYWQYGDHHMFHERYDEAERCYKCALELAQQTEYRNLYGIILSYLGQMEETRGNVEVAIQYYRESYARMQADGVRSATRPRNLGRMTLIKGDAAQARELFRIALDNAIHLASPLWTFQTLSVIADYLQTQKDLSNAVQLFAACFRILTELQESTAWVETKVAGLRAVLGAPAFDELWTLGKGLSMEQAIGLAQQQLDEQ